MQKRRYEILLPLQFNDGSPIPEEAHYLTREELIARFDAVSTYPGTVAGIWVHQGTRYEDSLVRMVVDVEDTPENRQFFVDWKPILRARFQQLEIYFTATVVEVI